MLLKVKNDIQEIDRILELIREFCSVHNICEKKCFDILIIVDELVTNIIKYAFNKDNDEHTFDVLLEVNGNIMHIQLIDEGVPFDPLKKADPDLDASLEDRNIGGLGILFVKQLSEMMTYERINNTNQLDVIVNLSN